MVGELTLMSEQPYMRPDPVKEDLSGVAPPPRLLWLVIGLFVFFALVGIVAFFVYQTQQRLLALIPVIVIAMALLVVASVIGAVIFRKSLPRHFAIWLTAVLIIFSVLGVVAGIFAFSNLLLPEYQSAVVEEAPFLRVFLPPTPMGGVLPTALPGNSDISPEDLLGAPLLSATETPEATEEAAALPEPTATEEVIAAEASATPTIAPTDTPVPTATPTIEATSIPAAATDAPTQVAQMAENAVSVSVPTRPSTELLTGFAYIRQDWNNCGPANITMALSYYGWRENQAYAASFLRPDREDKNVSPGELVNFVNQQTGVRAITRIGGDLNLLKDLLAARFPVIVETGGTNFEGYDWLGHYQTLVGYDDLEGVFYVFDSWLGNGEGAGRKESYNYLDENWKHFNRAFIVVYEQERETQVAQILGDLADTTKAAEHALVVAQEEARANQRDVYAWFNIGTAYTRLERYEEAAAAFDQASRIGTLPWRMSWYQFGQFEAYFNTGRYDDVMALVNVNLTNGAQYVEETHYWHGRVLEAQGDRSAAINAYNRALQHNSRYTAAREALDALNA